MINVKDCLSRLTGTMTVAGAAVFAFACMSLLLAGCATIPASLEDRAGIERVTVVPDTVPPEKHFETFAVGAGAGMGKGAAAGGLASLGGGAQGGSPYTLLLGIALMPLFAAVGAIAGAAIAVPEDRAAAIEALPKQVLATTAIERRLAELVAEAGRDSGYVLKLPPENADPSPSGAPVEAASDALLETDVTDFGFKGDGDDPDIAMFVRARARLVRMPAQKTLGESTFLFHSEPRKLSQWLDDGGKPLQTALDTLLHDLARDIVDRRLLHYPNGSLGDLELEFPGPWAISPGRSLLWPPTIDTLQPTLVWNAFSIPNELDDPTGGMTRAKMLGYEVCIWPWQETEQKRQRACVDRHLHLWNPKELQICMIVPRGCVYRHRGEPETSHAVAAPLQPDTRYFWSVRMRFRVDNDEYLTGWNRVPLVFDTPKAAGDRKP